MMHAPFWILEGRTPVPVGAAEWSEWMHRSEREDLRRVARTMLRTAAGDVDISTVFLAIDHAFGGRPLLFETMVFGGPWDELQRRYHTWEDAAAGHNALVAEIVTAPDGAAAAIKRLRAGRGR